MQTNYGVQRMTYGDTECCGGLGAGSSGPVTKNDEIDPRHSRERVPFESRATNLIPDMRWLQATFS